MSIYSLPPLISVIITSVFLWLLYKHAQNKDFKKLGITFCATVIWWQGCYIFLFSLKNEALANILARISYTGIIFLPPYYAEFICFAGTGRRSKFIQTIQKLSVLFLPFIWFSDQIIEGVWSYSFGFYPKCGKLHSIYLGLIFLLFIYTFSFLFLELSKNKPQKLQVKTAFISCIIFALATTDFLVKWGIEFYPFGWIFVSISIGYSLWKMFFSSFANLSILADRLKQEVLNEQKKSTYLLKVFSHDIKNRLTAEVNNLQRLKKYTSVSENINDFLENYMYINRMVTNLINVSSLHEIRLRKTTTDTKNIAGELHHDWALKFQNRNVVFQIEISRATEVFVDIQYMKLVWDNLLANAFQHTPEGGTVKIIFSLNRDFLEIAFSNSGEIIPEALRKDMFDKYLSPEKHTPYNKGLGLNYSKMMCELHGGDLKYLVNSEGRNEFLVKIPFKEKKIHNREISP